MSRVPGRRARVPLRTEAVILVPGALLALVSLSLFVILSYRDTVRHQLTESGERAERLASLAAARLGAGVLPQPAELRAWAPEAWAVAVLDTSGVPLVTFGDLVPRPVGRNATPAGAIWSLPPLTADDVISGHASTTAPGRAAAIRVDLWVPGLVSSARALRVLVPVVIATNVGLMAMLLLYLRRLISRFDRVVERARRAGAADEENDEVAFLLDTIDRALDSFSDGAPDELAAFRRAVSHGLEGGVLLVDADGSLLAASAKAGELLALASPTQRAPLQEALAPHSELIRVLEDAVSDRRAVQREECTIQTADGPRALGLTANPLRREDGTTRGFLVLFADLTAARKRADRERLADRLAHVGSLAAGVAHEMRNSLATVRGYLGLVERANDESRPEFLAELSRETDHLGLVLEDFLRFARPGSVRPEPVDLLNLLERCAADPGLEGPQPTVTPRPAGLQVEDRTLEADPNLLSHAIRNLLRNADEAQKAAGVDQAVAITLLVADDHISILVDDRGPGIAPDRVDQLFEPFASGRPGGVGLGLAITRRIVLLHGGGITITPRQEGGTRAAIVLPRLDSDDQIVTKRNESGYFDSLTPTRHKAAKDIESDT